MSSTAFTEKVTTIPAAWANDVDRVIYGVLGVPGTLAELQTRLGLAPLLSGGSFVVTGGSINNTPIGAVQPNTGRFTRVTVITDNTGPTDVVTHQQVTGLIAASVAGIRSMASQDSNAVALTGGTINGVSIGATVAAPGAFTTLRANDPVSGRDVVNIQTLNARWASLPNFGTMASQDYDDVNIEGGTLDNVTIGSVLPMPGAFTVLHADSVVGPKARLWLDGGSAAGANYAVMFDITSTSIFDFGISLPTTGKFKVLSDAGDLTFTTGRLAIGVTDNGVQRLQVGGDVKADNVLLNTIAPTLGNHATSKNYVDQGLASVQALIGPAVTAGLNTLSPMAQQDPDAVELTGGSIDGVIIGGVVPAAGSFTQVNSNVLIGTNGALNLAGTGGYVNSGAVIAATTALRPNVSVVPNANGAFVVMAGNTPVFRTHAHGRSVIGAGGEDGLNTLQVHGDAVVRGRLTFDGGTMTGSYTPALTDSPALAGSGRALWVRVRVETTSGPIECVVPAFPVL